VSDAEFIKILISFGAGSLLTLIGAWSNHLFSGQRWKAELRNSEVSYWRDFSDKWFSVTMDMAELNSPVRAGEIPVNLDELKRELLEKLRRVSDHHKDIWRLGTKRAPEPLTDHVRLFLARMERAKDAIPYDIELAKIAIVEFRSALDQYVRRGRVRRVRLFPEESAAEFPGGVGRIRIASGK